MKKHIMIGAALLVGGIGQAATITWNSSVNMYQGDANDESFVNTQGTAIVALNGTGDYVGTTGDVAVGGVTFLGERRNGFVYENDAASGTGIRVNASSQNSSAFLGGEFSSNADVTKLLSSCIYSASTIEMVGLKVGQQYLIQVFNNDARTSASTQKLAGFGNGTGSVAPVASSVLSNDPNGTANMAGDSIIGTFTADATSQTINLFGSSDGGVTFTAAAGTAQINAVQLRAIPEPATLGLIGAFGGGLLVIRRVFQL